MNKNEAIFYCVLWICIATIFYSLASCEARSKEAYYKHRTEITK